MTRKLCRVCRRKVRVEMCLPRGNICRKCHSLDCEARRKKALEPKPPDPLNLELRAWRGPVIQEPMRPTA